MSTSLEIKQYEQESLKLKEEIEKRTGKTTEQLYEEREKRVRDVIENKVPDRIPLTAHLNVCQYSGIPNSAAYYDPIGYKRAVRKATLDLEPDMCNAGLPMPGKALEVMDVQNRQWPGGPLPPDYGYQFLEKEFMKEEEYDIFLNDPTDFMIRYFLPRMFGALKPLTKLPPLGVTLQGLEGFTPMFTTPEFLKMARALHKAGRETARFRKIIGDSYEELAVLGFPAFAHVGAGGAGGAPFDTLSSFYRGMQGAMIDMFRRPEKLLRACDLILEQHIANAKPADPKMRGNPKRTGIPLWRGDKVFMSDKQFERFYWPGLKKALQATIDLGYVPVPFFEAKFGDRLEHPLELPKDKVIASIEYVDAVKAKEILKGHTCLFVRIPLSSKVWSLQEVEDFTKDLIDKCGKGGGIIVEVRMPDKGGPEEFKKLMNTLREYGRY
jgi:hypothetical protein